MGVRFESVDNISATIPAVFGLAGAAGSGKTYSALMLACGITTPDKIFFIDTEAGRALAYREEFKFEYYMLKAPYTVERYRDAYDAALAAGAKVIIIDSATHEHEGVGGILEQAEAVLDRMAGDDYAKRERCNMIAWGKVKPPRTRFISHIMGQQVVTILCFQAKPKTKPMKDEKTGKIKPVDIGFQPVCGNEYTYALTAFAMFHADKPGVPVFDADTKPLMHQLRPIFGDGKQISQETGKALAKWVNMDKFVSQETERVFLLIDNESVAFKSQLEAVRGLYAVLKKKPESERATVADDNQFFIDSLAEKAKDDKEIAGALNYINALLTPKPMAA